MHRRSSHPRAFIRILGGLLPLVPRWVLLELIRDRVPLPHIIRLFDTRRVRVSSPARVAEGIRVLRALVGKCYRKGGHLQQTLLLFCFLRRRGYPVRFHFGIFARDHGKAVATHAWLSLAGRPIFERGDPRRVYTTIYTYPLHVSNEHEVYYAWLYEADRQEKRATA